MNKKFEYVDDNPGSYFGMLVESVENKKDTKKKKINESTKYEYLENELAEVSNDKDIERAYDENELTIVKLGNVYYMEHCPDELVKKVKTLMKKYYPNLVYLYDIDLMNYSSQNESLKEGIDKQLVQKLYSMWFSKEQAEWLAKNAKDYAESLAYGHTTTDDLIEAEEYVNSKMKKQESLKEDKFVPQDKMSKKDKNESLKEDKNSFRNWIEKKVGKQMSNMRPTKIGYKHGRPYYAIDFTDGTSDDYFIDFDKEEVEKCESLKEDKFIPQDKMSKKAKKELNDKKRGTWGNTNPVTRVQPNKKAYDRKRDKKADLDESKRLNESSDGWDESKLYDLSEILDEIYNLQYEVKNTVRGAYTNAHTYEELGYYVHNLGSNLMDVGDEIMEMEEEDDEDED